MNSYADPSSARKSFSELLLAVADVPGMKRVRFTTSHPSDFGADIVRAIESNPVLCDHVHLPVQSGSTKLLRAMKRTYTREEYCRENFTDTRRIARDQHYVGHYCWISGRNGRRFRGHTEPAGCGAIRQRVLVHVFAAAKHAAKDMPDAIPEEEKVRRLAVLQERQREIQIVRNENCVGREYEVLVDGAAAERRTLAGSHDEQSNDRFYFAAHELLGQYLKVRVTRGGPGCMFGEHVVECEQSQLIFSVNREGHNGS